MEKRKTKSLSKTSKERIKNSKTKRNNFLVYKAELSSGKYFYLPMSKCIYNMLPKKRNIIKRIIVRDKLTLEEANSFWEIICKLKGV